MTTIRIHENWQIGIEPGSSVKLDSFTVIIEAGEGDMARRWMAEFDQRWDATKFISALQGGMRQLDEMLAEREKK